jgi:hypothetical protein
MDTEVHPELVNSRFAYVSISRASHDAQIFTNDASALAERLSRDISKASAISFDKRDNPVAVIGLGQAKVSGETSAFGLGLAP